MSRRDYRCALSGVSLLDAEVGLILLQKLDGTWRPASLPLWGRYDGLGTAADINDGPNSDLILAAIQGLKEKGALSIDFAAMGFEECELDHVETAMSFVACSQVSDLDAFKTGDGAIGFALVAAHVAAAAMDAEPELSPEVSLEALPERVFETPLGREIYGPLKHQAMKMRCKFGLTLSGLLSLDQKMKSQDISWHAQDAGIAEEEAQPALWLAEAMVKFSDDALMVEALEDYAGQDAEEPS